MIQSIVGCWLNMLAVFTIRAWNRGTMPFLSNVVRDRYRGCQWLVE
jgi:hypothetical protein